MQDLKKNFFQIYSLKFKKLISLNKSTVNNLKVLREKLIDLKKINGKVIIFGNGGSAAIANHFSIDLTKIAGIRCVNFNESSLITCYSNDFGYENWVKKSLEFYADKKDIIILISSSGKSKNMITACKYAKKINCNLVVTFSGFKKNNALNKLGDVNFWVNSAQYNFIENIHQYLLLSLVDSFKR